MIDATSSLFPEAAAVYCGTAAHLLGDPAGGSARLEIIPNARLIVDRDGRILSCQDRDTPLETSDQVPILDFGRAWLIPGLIDAHLHFPQIYAIGQPLPSLLDWLNVTVFPAELRLQDPLLARHAAERFVERLLASGTTTAQVFGSQFLPANLALFQCAHSAGLRLIAGMTLMDQGAPAPLLQSLETIEEQTAELYAFTRDKPLLGYAVTPRFALSCSHRLLRRCGELVQALPGCRVQTHINESLAEARATQNAFPEFGSYLHIYDYYGLITPRTTLAHNVYPSDNELQLLAERGSAVAHCPGSNLCLGSGLFPLRRHQTFGIPVCLGTDVGAGTTFSIWEETREAHKVQALQGNPLDARQLLYLATLGGAVALGLEQETGNFQAGKSADFLVLDPLSDTLLGERLAYCNSPSEQLTCLLHLAGPQHIVSTFVRGRQCHPNPTLLS